MMGHRQVEQAALFYEFRSKGTFRRIICCGLSTGLWSWEKSVGNWRRLQRDGRPSIDPELMIRMLIVGYCFGIRSERRLCEEVHLNLAYRGSAGSGSLAKYRITRPSRRTDTAACARVIYCVGYSRRFSRAVSMKDWLVGKPLRSMQA